MYKKYTMQLSTKGIKEMEEILDRLAKNMDKASKNIVKDLSDYGLSKMIEIYNASNFQSVEPMEFNVTGDDYAKTVTMSGTQAIYNEFGTGTEGQMQPHPIKNNFDLNEYNSGKTIRPANASVSEKTGISKGGLYWTYKDANGEIVYTQGTPAQGEGYYSLMETIKKADEIVKRRVEEALNG